MLTAFDKGEYNPIFVLCWWKRKDEARTEPIVLRFRSDLI